MTALAWVLGAALLIRADERGKCQCPMPCCDEEQP